MSAQARRLLRLAARSDNTFREIELDGEPVLVGKCIQCGRKLVVSLLEDRPSTATLEHIVPKNKGGTDALKNLAVACARCNHEKGRTLDRRRHSDPAFEEKIRVLQARREARWVDP